MGDSDLIARKLIDLGEVDDFNAELSAAQKAQDYMLRILVEEKIYYFGVCLDLFRSFVFRET